MPNSSRPWVDNPIKADKIDATKIDHLQLFGPSGDEIASVYWTPSGRYRVRVGWFGRLRLEQQLVFSRPGSPTFTSWRVAPRGTVAEFLRPIGRGAHHRG